MKKLLLFVLVGSYALAYMNWKSVQYTRLTHPELKEWAHAHETTYAAAINVFRYAVCPPCSILEPVLFATFKRVEASKEQQESITHAPDPDWKGFYHLTRRGDSWTFVPWSAWVLYWVPLSAVWLRMIRRFWK
jgi:hypothetical protein